MEEQYAAHLSGFSNWSQLSHAEDWVLFPENLGEYISIDETSVSQGELYTIVTNKAGEGKKGTIVAIIKGTNSDKVRKVLRKIPLSQRKKVKEITLDMAPTMKKIAMYSFPCANMVTDRFHVQQLAFEAVQELRIKHRWTALDQENKEIELAKSINQKYTPEILENGDTLKQLLARSRFLLFKRENKWTSNQVTRAEILFKYYPDLECAYKLSMSLGQIYHTTKDKNIAFTRLARWYDQVEKAGFKSFNTIAKSIQNHYKTILNYFDNRSTNASAESFNAKNKSL